MAAPAIDKTKQRRKVRMSYEEYLALPDDGIIEWVEGEVIRHMPATESHQAIVGLLFALLRDYVNVFDLGRVILAPFIVKLWPAGPAREPDILFIRQDRLSSLSSHQFDGGPNLVVEIVSPGSVTIDRVDKFREYERAGVGEYWIIDPRRQKQQADFYVRDEQGHFAPIDIDDDGRYTSTLLPGFRLPIAWLWQPEAVNVQRALAGMLVENPNLSDELRAVYRELLRLTA